MLWHPSANCGERRDGLTPDLIVLHYTAMQTAEAAIERLCDPEFEVSAHYVIGADGSVTQLVDEAQRAWHAGVGSWQGLDDINSRSIGIELANPGICPFAAPQMNALDALMRGIMQRWAIRPERVIGHSDMAPLRKFDPGRRFDWRRLALSGLSIWPEEAAATRSFYEAVLEFGYPDGGEDAVLDAFRQRFRPWADGPMDTTDTSLANDLANRFGVDRQAQTA